MYSQVLCTAYLMRLFCFVFCFRNWSAVSPGQLLASDPKTCYCRCGLCRFSIAKIHPLSHLLRTCRAQPLLAEELPLEFPDFASYPLISVDTRPTNISIRWWDNNLDKADSNCSTAANCDIGSLPLLFIYCLSYRNLYCGCSYFEL